MENNNFLDADKSGSLDFTTVNPLEQKIELLKEEITISKKVETEKFLFEKKVETIKENFPLELTSHDIEIERIPVNKEIERYPETRTEGNKTIISVVKEVPVVIKKLVLVEEIHITKNENTRTEIVSEEVREERFSTNFNSEK